MPVYPTFARALESHLDPAADAEIALAVSGGSDSTALAVLISEYRRRRTPAWSPVIFHVHHGVRAERADRDASAVEALASALDLPFVRSDVDVTARRDRTGESFETAARQLRYAALADWANARPRSPAAVLTAHTADDQAETVLMRILRGTGLHGLRGIPASRPLAGTEACRVLRPLLQVRKSELSEWRREFGFAACHDETNRDVEHRRNAVRRSILPLLESHYGGDATAALARLSEEAEESLEALESLARPAIEQIESENGGLRIGVPTLRELPAAARMSVFREMWRRANGSSLDLFSDHFRTFQQFVSMDAGGRYDLPGDWILRRRGSVIGLERRE